MARTVTLDSFLAKAESSALASASPVARVDDTRPVMDQLKALSPGAASRTDMVLPTLEAGEQYRFHFDMTRCIGCRCCEVACNEQNGNPAEVTWRRVGELEGGTFPHVKRFHLSMACNHCLEPACLEGCPTSAYEKLPNGIVQHKADSCIGCQYCTWNCPYGVPQYNPERRIVTKCHMCVGRMGEGNLPACVEACPVQAIQIEKVNVAEWRTAIDTANAPGVPPADLTLSTTRITLPQDLPLDFGKTSAQRLEAEPAHWSLVYFLTLSQASVGAALAACLLAFTQASALSGWMSVLALLVGHAALAGTLFHLGRPVHAFKAIRGFRRSWLSREVLAFSAYAGLAVLPAADHLAQVFLERQLLPPALNLLALLGTLASGLAGVYTSVRIYRIPARPAWHSSRTTAGFFLSSLVLGSALTLLLGLVLSAGSSVMHAAALVFAASCLMSAVLPWLLASEGTAEEPALRSAAKLLRQEFGLLLSLRTWLASALALSALALAYGLLGHFTLGTALALALLSLLVETSGRYLFFRCVVPRNMPMHFFSAKPAH